MIYAEKQGTYRKECSHQFEIDAIAFYAEREILQISQRNLQDRAPNASRARLKFDTEVESLVGTRRESGSDLRRAGRTDVVTHRLPAQRRSPSETFP